MPNSGKKNQEKRYVTVDFNGRKVQVLDLSGLERPQQRVKLNKHWSNRTGQHVEWGLELDRECDRALERDVAGEKERFGGA